MPATFDTFLTASRQRVNAALDHHLPKSDAQPERLAQAMRYSLFNGGKRIRAALVYAAANTVGLPRHDCDLAACAVELVHAYSLVHDDLPAMDDDELRRGQATCHIQFDEATAILCGDALQSLAFSVLGQLTETPAANALRMTHILADAIGFAGMAGGQMLDLMAETTPVDLSLLEQIHRRKTGALISASIELGALASGVSDGAHLQALQHYAAAIGLAFQVQDDILDVEGSTSKLGKVQGADQARHKSTYCSLLGLDGAKVLLLELHQQAYDATTPLSSGHDLLRHLADYIVHRDH